MSAMCGAGGRPVADFLRAFQAGRPGPGLPPAPHIALIAPRPFEN